MNVFKRLAADEVPLDQMVASLEGTIKSVPSVSQLLTVLQKIIHQIQADMQIIVEPGVDAGMLIHLAFLVEALKTGQEARKFKDLAAFKAKNRIEINAVQSNLMPLEKQYDIILPESEIAYVAQMMLENKINQEYLDTH